MIFQANGFNNNSKIELDFRSNFFTQILITTCEDDVSSYSKLKICLIVLNFPIENAHFHIDLRFNNFRKFINSYDDLFNKLNNSPHPNIIDLRENNFDIESTKKLRAFIQLNQDANNDHLKADAYLSPINFNCNNSDFEKYSIDYDKFDHLLDFDPWEKIPMFSVITGKNGYGKSTVLEFVKELCFKMFEERKHHNGKLLIPVLLKLHGSIEANKNFLDELKKNKQIEFENGISILSIYDLDLALDFCSDQLERLNSHLCQQEYKYTVSKENKTYFLNYIDLKINLEQLSPGEQMILLLYIWQYLLSRYPFQDKNFVILLDEPDAHLHPQAVHEFIYILNSLLGRRTNYHDHTRPDNR